MNICAWFSSKNIRIIKNENKLVTMTNSVLTFVGQNEISSKKFASSRYDINVTCHSKHIDLYTCIYTAKLPIFCICRIILLLLKVKRFIKMIWLKYKSILILSIINIIKLLLYKMNIFSL